MASEQLRPKVVRFRAHRRAHQHRLDPKRLIFIDETWIKTNMTRACGWSPRGKRRTAYVPHGHWKTLTFLAGLRHDRIVALFELDGPINADAFTAWVGPAVGIQHWEAKAPWSSNVKWPKSALGAAQIRDRITAAR